VSAALRLSVQRALLGEVFPQLRAVYVVAEPMAWRVRFYVDGIISDADMDSLTGAGAEIASDLPAGFAYDEKIERLDAPSKIVLADTWLMAFARREQMA
jgi:hypothetical protein